MFEKTPMLLVVRNWFRRNFSDPGAIGLFFTLVLGFVLVELFGSILLPIIISIVIAYLLNTLVVWLQCWRLPRIIGVYVIYSIFVGLFFLALFGLLPLLWKQLSNMLTELPQAVAKGQVWLNSMAQQYPRFFSGDPLTQVTVFLKDQATRSGRYLLTLSLSTIPGLIEMIIYCVLVPIMVFFFLKDGRVILDWISRFLPSNRGVLQRVCADVHQKIGAYVKGRALEVSIVIFASVIAFGLLGLQYAALLGALVGISVLVPYIGAALVTIPIVSIGLMQWGFSSHFGYLILVYVSIYMIDGNILFPLLFSESMNLHPIVIILAVLFFGGIWGFWGVFFAIPLATLVRSILDSWPQVREPSEELVTEG